MLTIWGEHGTRSVLSFVGDDRGRVPADDRGPDPEDQERDQPENIAHIHFWSI